MHYQYYSMDNTNKYTFANWFLSELHKNLEMLYLVAVYMQYEVQGHLGMMAEYSRSSLL